MASCLVACAAPWEAFPSSFVVVGDMKGVDGEEGTCHPAALASNPAHDSLHSALDKPLLLQHLF